MHGHGKTGQRWLVGIAEHGPVLELDLSKHLVGLLGPAQRLGERREFLRLGVLAGDLDEAAAVELVVQLAVETVDLLGALDAQPLEALQLLVEGLLVAGARVLGERLAETFDLLCAHRRLGGIRLRFLVGLVVGLCIGAGGYGLAGLGLNGLVSHGFAVGLLAVSSALVSVSRPCLALVRSFGAGAILRIVASGVTLDVGQILFRERLGRLSPACLFIRHPNRSPSCRSVSSRPCHP